MVSQGKALERWLKIVPDVVAITSMSRTKIYEAINSGRLRTVKEGRSVRVPESALQDFMKASEAASCKS